MERQPFSQTVVGVVVLGVLVWVVGGLALKWLTDIRAPLPHNSSSAAATTPRVGEGQPQKQILLPATASSEARPTSASDTSRPPVVMHEQGTDVDEKKRKTREEIDLADRTQAASQADQQRRAGYLSSTRLPSKVEFLVCAETAAMAPMGAFTTALTEHLNASGKAASGFVFSPEFVTAGAFDSFFVGRGGRDIGNMPLSGMGSKIFLARVSSSVKPGASVAGLFTASVVVAFSVVSSNDGIAVDGFELRAAGAGTSESDAASQALERILELLGQRGY